MADTPRDEQLRDMAQHRGLKLVKSRRRKAGKGDYGKFALLDSSGKPLLGQGKEGLTASADEIETYLRSLTAGTWQASAAQAPAVKTGRTKDRAKGDRAATDEVSISRRTKRAETRKEENGPEHTGQPAPERGGKRGEKRPAPMTGTAPVEATAPLLYRKARPSDADALGQLVSQLRGLKVDRQTIVRNLAGARSGPSGLLIAEQGTLIGCCSWTVIPTLHKGPVGRITLLLVDKRHRRRGVGSELLAAAKLELGKAGCAVVEAMSDIDISNAHGFFRALGFFQTSYRFTADV